jgi:hypothetical protein
VTNGHGFFEWRAIKGHKAKQPYAIGMKDGSPFGLGGLWENWKDPATGEWVRTFAIITTDANELVAEIHDLDHRAGRLRALAGRGARPWRPDAAVPGRADAHVADFDAGQQA